MSVNVVPTGGLRFRLTCGSALPSRQRLADWRSRLIAGAAVGVRNWTKAPAVEPVGFVTTTRAW